MRLPLQSNCDIENPEEMALWALQSIPWTRHQPIGFPDLMGRAISKHLSRCGFRLNPDLQEIRFRPPYRGQQHSLNVSGIWVPLDAVDPEPVSIPDMSTMTVHEQEHVIQQLKQLGRITDPPKDIKTAKATSLKELRGEGKL